MRPPEPLLTGGKATNDAQIETKRSCYKKNVALNQQRNTAASTTRRFKKRLHAEDRVGAIWTASFRKLLCLKSWARSTHKLACGGTIVFLQNVNEPGQRSINLSQLIGRILNRIDDSGVKPGHVLRHICRVEIAFHLVFARLAHGDLLLVPGTGSLAHLAEAFTPVFYCSVVKLRTRDDANGVARKPGLPMARADCASHFAILARL